ncbi:MAG: DinB/UmuC family translesion DNA polymerase, partial [Flavisolibacter sp.]
LVPVTEIYSIDEIFADLTSMKWTDLNKLALEIREKVKRFTGIPVSVGIGATKTLAKMANRYAKKTRPAIGVYAADAREKTEAMLRNTAVGQIWGIGKQYTALLEKNGFHSAFDLSNAPEEWVRKNLSVVGQRMLHELKGIACIEWDFEPPARKNITTSRSFGQLITDKEEIRQALAKFTSNCAEKLRKENSCARKMNVFIQTNPHRPTDEQYFQSINLHLKVATNLTTELMRYAMQGLDHIFKPGYLYQKCGVIMMDLVPQDTIQGSLFDSVQRKKSRVLMRSIDEVNRQYNRDTVRFATQSYENRWKLKQDFLSQHYTTRFDQLPKAKAT